MRFRKLLGIGLIAILAFAGLVISTTTTASAATCPYRNVKLEWSSPAFDGGNGLSTASYCANGTWHWVSHANAAYYGTLVPTPTAGVGVLHMNKHPRETFIAGVGPMLYGDSAGTVVRDYKQDAPMWIHDTWGNRLDALTAEAVLHDPNLAP